MSGKSTVKGGKPRRDGSSAKPQLIDPKTGRKYKDTLDNRRKLGMLADDVPKDQPGQTERLASSGPAQSGLLGTETEQAARARLAGAGGRSDVIPPTADNVPELEPIDFAQLVEVANILLAAKWPHAKMTDAEQRAIGKGLDAVISKYWPGMKTAGPEFALALAVMSYVTRVFLGPMLSDTCLSSNNAAQQPS